MDPEAAYQGLADSLDRTGALIAGAPPDTMDAPTPCTSWDVERLIAHIVQDLRHFTATASGEERDSSRAENGDAGARAYDKAARELVEAWRQGGVEGRTLHVRMGDFPATWAVSQQTADVIVHGWDVAKATGQRASFDPDVTLATLEWAKQNLKPEFRGGEESGKAFGEVVQVSDEQPPIDRLVGWFGRDPAWSPPGRSERT
jgi:uncharacterized protein (TIGR03086 family)